MNHIPKTGPIHKDEAARKRAARLLRIRINTYQRGSFNKICRTLKDCGTFTPEKVDYYLEKYKNK